MHMAIRALAGYLLPYLGKSFAEVEGGPR